MMNGMITGYDTQSWKQISINVNHQLPLYEYIKEDVAWTITTWTRSGMVTDALKNHSFLKLFWQRGGISWSESAWHECFVYNRKSSKVDSTISKCIWKMWPFRLYFILSFLMLLFPHQPNILIIHIAIFLEKSANLLWLAFFCWCFTWLFIKHLLVLDGKNKTFFYSVTLFRPNYSLRKWSPD